MPGGEYEYRQKRSWPTGRQLPTDTNNWHQPPRRRSTIARIRQSKSHPLSVSSAWVHALCSWKATIRWRRH